MIEKKEIEMRNRVCLTLVVVLAACSTPSAVSPISFPLQYKTTASPGEFPTLPSCAAISGVQAVDSRTDKAIGKRFIEGKTASADVMVTSDLAEWVRAGALDALKRGGVTPGSSGSTIRLSIDQIVTSENVLHRSGYEGRIVLSAELLSKSGDSCWKERVEGSSENYGYAGSAENYQETLNHALDRAMIRLLGSPDLKKAICSCGG
jgi:hypothetical protein